MPKQLTELQLKFLDALAGDAKGDLKLAKKMAGYAETTMTSEIVAPLKDEILEATKHYLAINAMKAGHGLTDAIDNPSRVGTANAVKASTEILDRIGLVKPETQSGPMITPIFVLPDKKVDEDE